MSAGGERPSLSRRLAAIGSIALAATFAVLVVVGVVTQPLQLVAVVALLGVVADAAWYAVSRAGTTRRLATAVLVASLALAGALLFSAPGWPLLLRVALLALAFLLGRYALERDVKALKAAPTPGRRVPAASRGALIMNLRSGGGKAERFHLEEECRKRGIEAIVMRPGDDLRELAEGAIDRGADVLGMAGGDGSQALVASVAAERGVPMVVVPAGTRNHLALDLGLDRDDVVGALDAYGEAVERPMDLAEVNGRVFVNNVSLGLYAEIVRSPEYRDAKAETTLAELPKLLGPEARPFDLRFVCGRGERHEAAQVVQVSNDPYGETLLGLGTRPRLDEGRLGVVSLVIPDDQAERRFVRALATGHPDRYEGFETWASSRFELTSGEPVAAGVDGETMELQPPLVFTSRPRVLRVRLPQHAVGLSPAARQIGFRQLLPELWRTARGKPSRLSNSR